MKLSEFANQMQSGDYARTNLYHVELGHIKGQELFYHKKARDYNKDNMRFMVKQVTLPGKSLGTVDIKRFGAIFKVANDVIVDTVTMTILCSEDMRERIFFESWIDYIYSYDNEINLTSGYRAADGNIAHKPGEKIDFNFNRSADNPDIPISGSKHKVYRMAYYDDYISNVAIKTLNRTNKTSYMVDLIEAYPTNVGPIELSWGDAGEVASFTVTFSYRDWFANLEENIDEDGWTAELAEKIMQDMEEQEQSMIVQTEADDELLDLIYGDSIEAVENMQKDAINIAKDAKDYADASRLLNDVEYIEDFKKDSEYKEMMSFINGTDTDMQPFINEDGQTRFIDVNDEQQVRLFEKNGYLHSEHLADKRDRKLEQEDEDRQRKNKAYDFKNSAIDAEYKNSVIPEFGPIETNANWLKTGELDLSIDPMAKSTSISEVELDDGRLLRKSKTVAASEIEVEMKDDRTNFEKLTDGEFSDIQWFAPAPGEEKPENLKTFLIGEETDSVSVSSGMLPESQIHIAADSRDYADMKTKTSEPAYETIKNNPNASQEMMDEAETDFLMLDSEIDQDEMEARYEIDSHLDSINADADDMLMGIKMGEDLETAGQQQDEMEAQTLVDADLDALTADADRMTMEANVEIAEENMNRRQNEVDFLMDQRDEMEIELAGQQQDEMEAQSKIDSHLDSITADADRMTMEANVEIAEERKNQIQNEVDNSTTAKLDTTTYDANKKYQQDLSQVKNDYHQLVEMETKGSGFFGFNPVRGMAHKEVNKIMNTFNDPASVTTNQIIDTRNYIEQKAHSMLEPHKAQAVVDRYDNFLGDIGDYAIGTNNPIKTMGLESTTPTNKATRIK